MNAPHAFVWALASLAFLSGLCAHFSKSLNASLSILNKLYLYNIMVVLTMVGKNNGETVYFEEPLPKVHFIRLISCSLYNSWHNLERVGQISFKNSGQVLASLPQGYYIVESLAKELTESFKNEAKIAVETNKPNSVLKIIRRDPDIQQISVRYALARLLGIGVTLNDISYVKKLNSPSTYFIHCDLLDKTKNFLNGKRSDVLVMFDIQGLPYAKVSYDSTPQQVLRDCSTDAHVNSITVSIKDEHGELFDFKGMPLGFELEIN